MTSRLRRAGGFALVGTLALTGPTLGRAAAVPFAALAVLAVFVVDDGPLFELFARPGDREERRLNGLAGFCLAAAGLALLATFPGQPMPMGVYVASVFVLAFGNVGAQAVRERSTDEFAVTTGFLVLGTLAGVVGQVTVDLVTAAAVSLGSNAVTLPTYVFYAVVGAHVAALLRSVLFERDDPLVMLTVGFVLWFFTELVEAVGPIEMLAALAVTVVFGFLAYRLGTASVPGMLTGVLLGLLTIVLGGFGWFAVLIAFFGIGGLSAKFGYDRKAERGVAEDNEGARGSGNVLGNSAVAMVAVLGYAASGQYGFPPAPFLFAFAGSLATAMSDTLSSEIGGLFNHPRLITTFEPVAPGTDGGVTWQGELAGIVGAAAVAAITAALLPLGAPLVGSAIVALSGVAGMTVDSLLGATLEGERLGNQAVNFLATLSGAAISMALAVVLLT